MTKLVSLFMALMMVLSMVGMAQAEAPALEATTLKFAAIGSDTAGKAEVLAAVNEKLQADGLPFSIEVEYLDDYWNKLAMTVAGGEELDIVWAHVNTLSDLVAKKCYQPIDEAMANYGQDLLANTPEYVLMSGTIGGQLYALPRVIPMASYNMIYNIRGDLREKYGIDKITTLEGLEEYFDAILANEPDMYCIIDPSTGGVLPVFANFYFPIGDGGRTPLYVDPADESYTVKTFFDSEEFAAMAASRLEWREKGYFPVDDTKVTNAQLGFYNNQVACLASSLMSESERVDEFTRNMPDAWIETVRLNPDELYMFESADNMLAVASTSKHVNESVAFINWLKSNQENYDLFTYGIEGVNYNLDGEAVSTDGIAEEHVYNSNCSWMWNDLRLARFSQYISQDYLDLLASWDANATQTPFVGFALDQSNIKAEISNVNAVSEEYFRNIMYGLQDYEEIKDEFQAKLEASGIQTVQEECQRQLDAWLGK